MLRQVLLRNVARNAELQVRIRPPRIAAVGRSFDCHAVTMSWNEQIRPVFGNRDREGFRVSDVPRIDHLCVRGQVTHVDVVEIRAVRRRPMHCDRRVLRDLRIIDGRYKCRTPQRRAVAHRHIRVRRDPFFIAFVMNDTVHVCADSNFIRSAVLEITRSDRILIIGIIDTLAVQNLLIRAVVFTVGHVAHGHHIVICVFAICPLQRQRTGRNNLLFLRRRDHGKLVGRIQRIFGNDRRLAQQRIPFCPILGINFIFKSGERPVFVLRIILITVLYR